jgi:hypothetical protein
MLRPTDPGARRAVGASLLFVAVFGVAVFSAARPGQLGSLGGITDEYFALGAKLRVNGTLGLERNEPSALRPPGYPAFVAAVLWAFVDPPARLDASEFRARGRRAVSVCQAALLAIAASALFLWLSARLHLLAAATAAALLGLSPGSIVLTGLSHYDVLHWLLLVLSSWATDEALRSRRPFAGLVGAGVLWGLSNLVRPVTLLLPAFLLVGCWLWQRAPLRAAAGRALGLGLGMALALAPWTARNRALTGRLVPVADNGWATLWGQTVKPLRPDPSRYVWFELFEHDLLPVFARVTGSPRYDYVLANRRNAELEAEFRKEALRNLRERPAVYAGNALAVFWSFNADVAAVLLTAYRQVQAPDPGFRGAQGRTPPQDWFRPDRETPLASSRLASTFSAFTRVISLLAAAGVWVGATRRSPTVLVAVVAYACAASTHALVFMHFLHYYVKWPFVLAGLAFLLDAWICEGRRARASVTAAGLLVACLALAAWTLWP